MIEYDIRGVNRDATATIPVALLKDLTAVAGGYSMSNGRWLNKQSIIREVDTLIYEDTDYETFHPTLFRWDGEILTPREDLIS